MYRSLMPHMSPGPSGPLWQSVHSFNQTGRTSPAAGQTQTPGLVKNAYSSFSNHMMWKQKKTKLTTFLARYHGKPYGFLILALPLYASDILYCIQQAWQWPSPIFHRHSHQAGCKSDLNVWPDFLMSVSPLPVSCLVLFQFPWFLFFCVCTFFSFHLLGLEFDRLREAPGHKFPLKWGGTGLSQAGATGCAASFRCKSTTVTRGGSSAKLTTDTWKRIQIETWTHTYQTKLTSTTGRICIWLETPSSFLMEIFHKNFFPIKIIMEMVAFLSGWCELQNPSVLKICWWKGLYRHLTPHSWRMVTQSSNQIPTPVPALRSPGEEPKSRPSVIYSFIYFS